MINKQTVILEISKQLNIDPNQLILLKSWKDYIQEDKVVFNKEDILITNEIYLKRDIENKKQRIREYLEENEKLRALSPRTDLNIIDTEEYLTLTLPNTYKKQKYVYNKKYIKDKNSFIEDFIKDREFDVDYEITSNIKRINILKQNIRELEKSLL